MAALRVVLIIGYSGLFIGVYRSYVYISNENSYEGIVYYVGAGFSAIIIMLINSQIKKINDSRNQNNIKSN
jgi:divalent metal cation (Fe/Co/Zn/Cd) transporter